MACVNKAHAKSISKSVKEHYRTRTEAQAEFWALRNKEARVGGFWYGSVKNDYGPIYCHKWNRYLKERIRAYWGYVSALSGEPETLTAGKMNTLRAISCHHVYYQKSACCMWDDDERNYYVILNTTTSKKNPKWERYYIEDGNPNKFVTLTHKENTLVENNKIAWIKIFERIIEDNGGKCFLSDNDVEKMQLADSIEI